jgi:small subunit ribosomal protein S11
MADEEVKPAENEALADAPVAEATDAAPTDATDGKPAEAPVKKKKSRKRAVPEGQVHVLATFNNTIITVTDTKGNVLTTSSAGAAGFRGSKKGTAYAAQVAAEKAIGDARQNYGLSKVDVQVKGVGLGREAAIRTLISQKMTVESVRDITGIAHGGVRPRKPKRN